MIFGEKVIETDGLTVSKSTVVEACVATFPEVSVKSAVIGKAELSSWPDTSCVPVVHEPPVQVGVTFNVPMETSTERVLSEQVPTTV